MKGQVGSTTAALAVLLLAAGGCSAPDTVRPEALGLRTVGLVETGTWEDLPVLAAGKQLTSLLAASPDEVYLACDTRLLRVAGGEVELVASEGVQGDGYRMIRDLALDFDGALLALRTGNTLLRREDAGWTEVAAPLDFSTQAMWSDGAGRLAVVGAYGAVLLGTPSGWERHDIATDDGLLDVCGDAAGLLAVCGQNGLVGVLRDGVWRLERPFGDLWDLIGIRTDGAGRFLVWSEYGAVLGLDEGAGWAALPLGPESGHELSPVSAAFGPDGVLALDADDPERGVWRWTGRLWVGLDPLPDLAKQPEDLTVCDGTILVGTDGGGLLRYEAGGWERLALEVGILRDFEPGDGRGWLVLTNDGWLLRLRASGGWTPEQKLDTGSSYYSSSIWHDLARDDAGQLLVRHSQGFHCEEPGGWRRWDLPEEIGNLVVQPDGRVLIVGRRRVWIWSNGSLEEAGEVGDDFGWLDAATTDGDGRVWVLESGRLARLTPGGTAEVFVLADGSIQGLAWAPGWGLVTYGNNGCQAWNPPVQLDLTPRTFHHGAWHATELEYLVVCADASWLAWTGAGRDGLSNGLLRFDAGGAWSYVQGVGHAAVDYVSDRSAVHPLDGVAVVCGNDRLLVYRDAPGGAAAP